MAILLAGVSLSHRYKTQGRAARQWMEVTIGPIVLVLSAWPSLRGDPQGRFWPLWTAVALAFGWISLSLADAARTTTAITPAHNRRTS